MPAVRPLLQSVDDAHPLEKELVHPETANVLFRDP